MLSNSFIQQRAKHFDFLLARELSLIKREHSHNLVTYQKLENSIRRTNNQLSNTPRTKISMPFNNIYNEQTGSIDYHSIRNNFNTQNSFLKRGQSIGGISNTSSSQNQTIFDRIDEFSDDTLSSFSSRRRRYCTKNQRLPPIIKSTTPNQKKRENKNHHWIASFQQTNTSKKNIDEPFTILNEEITKSNLSELTPIERQVRSFLETLPTYKGVQHGFDSFAPASIYSNRAPIVIR
jgi:hypothetical protein